MYTTVLHDGRTVGYYIDTLPSKGEEQDYMSVTVQAEDKDSAQKLFHRGFRFADRSILMEIQLRYFKSTLTQGRKFDLSIKSNWEPEDIYVVACECFENDCRFALDWEQRDTELKNALLLRYINDRKNKGDVATCLYREGKLEGFNLWKIQENKGRIMLGAVSRSYKNTGIGFSMYSYTLCAMRETGINMFSEYIASSNLTSLNLHAMLIRFAGGTFRFGSCRDHYKKEQSASM